MHSLSALMSFPNGCISVSPLKLWDEQRLSHFLESANSGILHNITKTHSKFHISVLIVDVFVNHHYNGNNELKQWTAKVDFRWSLQWMNEWIDHGYFNAQNISK